MPEEKGGRHNHPPNDGWLDRHIFFSPAVANSVAVDIEKLGASAGRLAVCHPFGGWVALPVCPAR